MTVPFYIFSLYLENASLATINKIKPAIPPMPISIVNIDSALSGLIA